MTLAIDIHAESVGWAGRRLMSTLELSLVEGETLVILGPGGSGKSTTLRVIQQAIEGRPSEVPDSSDALRWGGRARANVEQCARLRQHGEHHRISIGELLAARGLHLHEDWMPPNESARSQLRAAYALPLGDAPQPLRRFVSFSLVAHTAAPLLLFDEPCFALSGVWRHAVCSRLVELANARRTMVIVTHHLAFARAMADQVMLMVDGETIEACHAIDFFERPCHPRTRQYLKWGA